MKVLAPVSPVLIVRSAEAAVARTTPWALEKRVGSFAGIVFVTFPTAVPVTRKVIVQLDSTPASGRAATVAPVRTALPVPGKAWSDPPQPFVAAGFAARVSPSGSVSVRETAVRALTVRLKSLIVAVERPPWGMLVGLNAFVTATASTVTVMMLES